MSSSIFRSNTSQHRWAHKLDDHFISIYAHNPPCIFQVPKSTFDTNPEAYSPQKIGIGPYHHFRRDLDDMESTKLEAIKILKPEQLRNFNSLVVERVKALEPSIRSCYDKYLDLDSDTLALAMAIDGFYLLRLLETSLANNLQLIGARKLPRDVWMMENQLPIIVLNKIEEALVLPQASANCMPILQERNKDISENEFDVPSLQHHSQLQRFNDGRAMFLGMVSFCILNCPFQVAVGNNIGPYQILSPHLLGIMYQLVREKLSLDNPGKGDDQMEYGAAGPNLFTVPGVAAELIGINALELIEKFPWEKHAIQNSSTSIEQIQIPSISQLQQVSGIYFEKSARGIAIDYIGEHLHFFLPVMRLNTDSEVILRNLVAYESALRWDGNIISSYVDMMCGLVKTAKDVDLLKEKGIILTELPSGEVAKMFNGINKSSGMAKFLDKAIKRMNEVYDSHFRVRFSRFAKKRLIPSQSSVKLVLWILLVSLLVLQAFCQIYGCSDHWFPSK